MPNLLKRYSFIYLCTFGLLSGISSSVFAQGTIDNISGQWIVSGGYSGNSIRFLGKTTEAISRVSYIGYTRPTRFYWGKSRIFYSMGIYPVISFSYPRRDFNGTAGLAYGGGISPLGFYLNKPLLDDLSIGFSARSGIIYLNRFFPTNRARRLNYSFDISAQLEWQVTPLFSFAAGYTFHHISNAQTGKENPGLDSNFLFISFLINP